MLQISIAAIMPMGSALALAAVRDKVVADHAQFCVGHGAADGQRKKEFTHTELAQFTGTENLYSHSIAQNVHHTDGMLFVAEKAEAFCLIDEIALAQRSEAALAGEEFQVWKLTVEGTGQSCRAMTVTGGRC